MDRSALILVLFFFALGAVSRKASTVMRKKYSLEELRDFCRDVGFPDPYTAAAVAFAESGGDPGATNDTRGRTDLPAGTQAELSIGLWQINTLAHPEVNASRLTDPTYNAQCAFRISSLGTNWKPWSAYTSGAYQKHMPTGP